MRYMLFMIPPEYQPGSPAARKADKDFVPSPKEAEAMMKYNEALAKAHVLVSLDGLHPLIKGARVTFRKGKQIITEGSQIEARGDVIGGYWILDVKSKDEALEWAKKCPAVQMDSGAVIEIRQVFEMDEFPDEIRRSAESKVVLEEISRRKSEEARAHM